MTVFEDVSRILDQHDVRPKTAWFFIQENEWGTVGADLLGMMSAFNAANITTGLISPLGRTRIQQLIDENQWLRHILSHDDRGHLIRDANNIKSEAGRLASGSKGVTYDPAPRPTGQFALGSTARVQAPPFVDKGEIIIVTALLTCDLIAEYCLIRHCTSDLSTKALITSTNQFVAERKWHPAYFQEFLSGIILALPKP